MKFISHRGNVDGKMENEENKPSTIISTTDLGYDCEIDLWLVNDDLYLGHDNPEYLIPSDFLLDLRDLLWVHCKNIEAMVWCNNLSRGLLNYFWHETDKVVLTSKGYMWAYPGNQPITNSIAVMPEIHNEQELTKCNGICSDYIALYREKYGKI